MRAGGLMATGYSPTELLGQHRAEIDALLG
jgi:hypothetical protein